MGFKGAEVQILSSRPNDERPRQVDEKLDLPFHRNTAGTLL